MKPKCERCNDTGLFGYDKPMSGLDGNVHMVFVPQRCWCGINSDGLASHFAQAQQAQAVAAVVKKSQ